MTTGTGLVLLGVWLAVAACWFAPRVGGSMCLIMTIGAVIMTFLLK